METEKFTERFTDNLNLLNWPGLRIVRMRIKARQIHSILSMFNIGVAETVGYRGHSSVITLQEKSITHKRFSTWINKTLLLTARIDKGVLDPSIQT